MKKFLFALLFTFLGVTGSLGGAHFYLADLLAPATIYEIRDAKKSCEAFAAKLGAGTCTLAGGFFLKFDPQPPVRDSMPEDSI